MGPIIRIILRYGIGAFAGYEFGSRLADDPDMVAVATVVVTACAGAITEGYYYLAKKFGWKT